MFLETVPSELSHLRACLLCSLVKTLDQFEMHGCDNCEEVLSMRENREAVYDYTSANFDGMIAMMSPQDSWVARWQRVDLLVKGVYAISVTGRLKPHVVRELRRQNVFYRSRDTTQKPT